MLEVTVLGPVRVSDAGTDVRLGGAKQQAVLACLALNAPRACSAEALVAALWGEDPPTTAKNAVQVYVSGLRKALDGRGATVQRAGAGYRLAGDGLVIDVADFEQAVTAGRSALRAGDSRRATEVLRAALARWQGDPLSGLEMLPVHASASTELNRTRAEALRDLADSLCREACYDDAVRVAQDAVAARLYDERAWAILAQARYHAGRQTEALDTCRQLRELLAGELGLDPTPEMAELERQILNHTLSSARGAGEPSSPSTSPPAPASLPSLPRPFVGRGALVEQVTAALNERRMVNLVGLGGIGKTTVAVAVARRCADAGATAHFCDLQAETTAPAALDRVCRVVGVPAGDDPGTVLRGLPDATLLVLDNAEQVTGLATAVDDLVAGSRLRVLATSRRPLRVRGERVVQVPPLELQGAGASASPAVELFMARVHQARPGLDAAATTAAAVELCAWLEGIPLAIELAASRARVLTAEQMLARLRDGRTSALDRSRGNVPARHASLAAVLTATLESLEPAAENLVRWLASYDGWATLDLVEPVVAPRLGGEFVDALEDLTDAGLVELDAEGRVRMRSPVREFLRRAEDPSARDRAVVDDVKRLVAEVAATLHGASAGDGLKVLGANREPVIGALRRAIEAGWADDAADLTLGLNRYWLLSGRMTEGQRLSAQVAGLPSLSENSRARVKLLAGTFASYTNDPRAVDQLAPALAEAERMRLPADRLVVNAWCCLAAIRAHLGNLPQAQADAVSAAAAARESGDPTLVALARDLDGHIARYRGDTARALEVALAGIDDARRSGDRYDLVNVLVAAADDLVGLQRYDEAVALSAEAFDLVGALDVGPLLSYVLLVRGISLTTAGQVPAARGCLIEALRITRDRYPDRLATADILYALAAGMAAEGSDRAAARLWGAADAIYGDENVASGSRTPLLFETERAAVSDRLGAPRAAVLSRGGAAAPDNVIVTVLAGDPAS